MPSPSRTFAVVGVFLALVVMLGGLLKMQGTMQSSPTAQSAAPATSPATSTIEYQVVPKENTQNVSNTDVYLKDPSTSQEMLFLSGLELNRSHYHASEYHRGNVYLIKRTGGQNGPQDNSNWTDELWRYDQQKKGQKLYAVKGLDFRVSDDETHIAVFTNTSVELLDRQGQLLHSIPSRDLDSNEAMPGFLAWGDHSLWISSTMGPMMVALGKLDTQSFALTKYDLSTLHLGTETVVNPTQELLVFSTYPAIFDVDNARDFEKNKTKVTLTAYNLRTQKQLVIATTIAKRLTPRWLDQNTLEYNNPQGEGRITRTFP